MQHQTGKIATKNKWEKPNSFHNATGITFWRQDQVFLIKTKLCLDLSLYYGRIRVIIYGMNLYTQGEIYER